MELDSDTQSLLNSDNFKLSLDSNSEDVPYPWYSVIRNLTTNQIESLQAIFSEKIFRDKLSRKENGDSGLTKEEFVDAIDEVYGSARYSLQAILLFEEIDRTGKQTVTWSEFIEFLVQNLEIKAPKPVELSLSEITAVPHVKRETVIKIVLLETNKYFCYAIISKHGHVGLYDGNLNFLISYHVIMTREDVSKNDEDRRRRNRWITDAVFCSDNLMLIITNSARSITIYDASGLEHVAVWLIMGAPNIIHCFSYYNNCENGTSMLLMGDEHGQVSSFKFIQPKKGLFERKQNDKISLFYWQEMATQIEFVLFKMHGKFHNDGIRRLCYFGKTGIIITCSRDPKASVVSKHIANRKKPYVFKMPRGAFCFAVSEVLKILISGSDDGLIRIWNCVVTSNPVAILSTHRCGIVDIQICDSQQLFFSCSRDGVIKLWETKDYSCLQTLKLRFPVFGVMGKIVEWGTTSIYTGPKRSSFEDDENSYDNWERSNILIACCNYLAKITLVFSNSELQQACEFPVLPPPPLQNSVLIPATWNIADDANNIVQNSKLDPTELDEVVENRIKELDFILERDVIAEYGLVQDINYKISTLERKKLDMQWSVAQCAPYVALDLHNIEEIVLPPDLPVPKDNSVVRLIEKTRKMLTKANSKDQLFSEPPSSRSRSSRSSVIEFNF